LNKQHDTHTLRGYVTKHGKKIGTELYNAKIESIKKANAGKNNPMSISNIASRYNVCEDVARKYTPCYGRSGRKHPMYGKHHTLESKKKIAKRVKEKSP